MGFKQVEAKQYYQQLASLEIEGFALTEEKSAARIEHVGPKGSVVCFVEDDFHVDNQGRTCPEKFYFLASSEDIRFACTGVV